MVNTPCWQWSFVSSAGVGSGRPYSGEWCVVYAVTDRHHGHARSTHFWVNSQAEGGHLRKMIGLWFRGCRP